jgi:RHS repeat-associated protein
MGLFNCAHRAAVATASLLFLMVVGTAAATDAPILLRSDTSPPASIFNPGWGQAAPHAGQRGVNVDGSLRGAGLYGMQIAADPWATDAAATRGDGQVRLDTGSYAPTEVDLALPCAGAPWVIGRSYTGFSSPTSTGTHLQGNNWFQSSEPEVVRDDAMLYIVYGADRYLSFAQVGSSNTFRGVNGAAGAVSLEPIDSDSGPWNIYRYIDAEGAETDFFADDYGYFPTNHIWRVIAADGSMSYVGDRLDPVAAVEYGYSGGLIAFAWDSAGRKYSYWNGTRLHQVAVEDGSVLVGLVEYSYTASGDLESVKVTTPLSTGSLVREQWYRYDSQSRVRMVIEPEGARAATAALGSIETAADADLQPYASLLLTYDTTSGRVASVGKFGSEATPVTSMITYGSATTGTASPYSQSWYTRAIVQNPTSWTTYYFDNAGQGLSVVTTDLDPTSAGAKVWATLVERNSGGQIAAVHTPANVTGYTHAGSSEGTFTTAADSGLVTVLDRVSDGVMEGFLRSVRHKNGSGSAASAYYDSYLTYHAEPIGPDSASVEVGDASYRVHRPLITQAWRFPGLVTDSSSFDASTPVTTTDYTVSLANPLALQNTTTTYPPISAAHNGPGVDTVYNTKTLFNANGSTAFTRSRTGRINYYGYDQYTGRLTTFVQDASSSQLCADPSLGLVLDAIPADFRSDLTATPLHRVFRYAYDAQGRRTTVTPPTQRTSLSYYGVLGNSQPFVIEIPKTSSGTSYGPASCTVLNLDGKTAATFTIGLPEAAGGSYNESVFSSTDDPGTWLAAPATNIMGAIRGRPSDYTVGDLNTYEYSANGQELTGHRSYFQLPTLGDGAVRVDYDYNTLHYDATTGRLDKLTDPTGTIDKIEYDALGRPTARWRGTVDDSTGSNLVKIGAYQWDNGGEGNSRLTEYDAFPSADLAAVRSTKYFYNPVGDLIGVLNPAQPHAVFSYDNEHRTLGMALLDGTGFSPTDAVPDPFVNPLSTRRALFATSYDEIGQAYQQSDYNVDQSSGVYSQAVVTNKWYCAEGCVHCVQGATTVKNEMNRACQIIATATMVNAPVASGTPVYAQMTDIGTGDTVLHEEHYVYDEAGEYVATVTADRTAVDDPSNPCPSTGGGLLMDPVGLAPSGCDFSISHGSVPHNWDVAMVWRDPIGRPFWHGDFGNPSYLSDSPAFCRNNPYTFSNNPGIKLYYSSFDPLGRPRDQLRNVGVDPTDGSPLVDGWRHDYDGAGRLLQKLPLQWGGIAYECDNKPGTHYGYEDGHLNEIGMAVWPGHGLPVDPPTRYVLPRDLTPDGILFPEHLDQSDVHDNNLYFCRIGPGSSTAPGDLTAPHPDTTFFTYNALGEFKGAMDPSGLITVHELDPLGRERTRLLFPPSGGDDPFNRTVRSTEFTYDGLSRLNSVTQFDASHTQLSQSTFTHDGWGQLGMMVQDPGPSFNHGTSALPTTTFTNDFYDNHAQGGWSGVRVGQIAFPGGLTIRNTYGGSCGSGTDIDDMIARVTHVDRLATSFTPVVYQSYQGIANPASFELPSPVPLYDPNTLRHQLLDGPDGVSDGFGRTRHDLWCAGIAPAPFQTAGTCSPVYETRPTFDPADRIVDRHDLMCNSASTVSIYPDKCTSLAGMYTGENPTNNSWTSTSASALPTPWDLETWNLDSKNNITQYQLTQEGDPSATRGGLKADPCTRTYSFDADNKITSGTTSTGGSSGSPSFIYDANGNTTFDGTRYCRYDSEGNLTDVWHKDPSTGGQGAPWARFTYDGLGRLISAIYHDEDSVGQDASGNPLSDDAVFAAEPIEFYTYDEKWRVTSVWHAKRVFGGHRPAAACHERFVYASAGRNGRGDAWLLDCPVYSEISTNDNGVFDRVRRFLQNAQGDVVRVQEASTKWTSTDLRYSAFGVPRALPAAEPDTVYHTADFDGDGNIGTDQDIAAFWACIAGDCCATCGSVDVDRDGSLATDQDIEAFYAILSGSLSFDPSTIDIDFGFRGYRWDNHLKLYHVRHRVYDPNLGRWLQPDPAGYIDGLNLYAYCHGDPMNLIDPYGLNGYWFTRLIRGTRVGDYIDDSIDGIRESWSAESPEMQGMNRATWHAMKETGHTAVDVLVLATAFVGLDGNAVIEGEYNFRSEFFGQFDRGNDEERKAAGVRGAQVFAANAATLGLYSFMDALYRYSEDGDVEAFQNAMAGVGVSNTVAVGIGTVYVTMRMNSSEPIISAEPPGAENLRGTNARGQITSRGTFRKATVQDAWDNAPNGPNGGKLCPTCGKEVTVEPGSGTPRDWDVDHQPKWTDREFPPDCTRQQVIDNYQKGTRLRCPPCNRADQ